MPKTYNNKKVENIEQKGINRKQKKHLYGPMHWSWRYELTVKLNV